MGTSRTESCEGYLWTQFKPLPPQLALKLSLVRLVVIVLWAFSMQLPIPTQCTSEHTQNYQKSQEFDDVINIVI